jgi:hypothetical protein
VSRLLHVRADGLRGAHVSKQTVYPDALAIIDHSIVAAVAERNRCLRAWIHSPNHETCVALDVAQVELDLKLEQRYAAQGERDCE